MTLDTLILGAGVSGLACARRLGNSQRVLVLEGRERIGGRLHTLRSEYPLPIELGPEFIHGRAKETFDLLEDSGLVAYDLAYRHFEAGKGKPVEKPKAWDKVEELFSHLNRAGKKDISFKDFLARHAPNIDPNTRRRAIAYVEGFNAARYERIGVQGLHISAKEEEQLGEKQFRLVGGYDQLAQSLAARISRPSRIQLNTIAREIHWSRGRVKVIADTASGRRTFCAQRAVITLPLAVLQQSSDAMTGVRFEPELPTRSLLQHQLVMGNVVKITLHCQSAFWEKIASQDLSFVHAMGAAIPVWWTTLPLRTTLLTGWVGGSQVDRLKTDMSSLRKIAVTSLAQIFHRPARKIDEEILALHTHDWAADPFSLGAYSYVAVGGAKAPQKLAEPIENTLYFAGEHTHTGLIGTVAGAIQSGYHAADLILKANR